MSIDRNSPPSRVAEDLRIGAAALPAEWAAVAEVMNAAADYIESQAADAETVTQERDKGQLEAFFKEEGYT